MDELIQELEDEKKKRFSKSWTKLDKGSKLSRITIFVIFIPSDRIVMH